MRARGSLLPAALLWTLLSAAGAGAQDRIVLVAGGDVMFRRAWPPPLEAEGPGSFDGIAARSGRRVNALLPSLLRADAFLFNLETTIGGAGSPRAKTFRFAALMEDVDFLRSVPRTFVSLANNHVMDYGPEGLALTLRVLRAAGIGHAGAGTTLAAAQAAGHVVVGSRRVAVLCFGQDGETRSYAGEAAPGIASVDRGAMAPLVGAARRGADLVVVMLHWGAEYSTTATAWQRETARALVDAGADLVLGSGPHVLQGVEVYRGALVCYSLGNLVFDDLRTEETTATVLVRATFDLAAGSREFRLAPLRTMSTALGPLGPGVSDADAIAAAIARRSPDPRAVTLAHPAFEDGLYWYLVR